MKPNVMKTNGTPQSDSKHLEGRKLLDAPVLLSDAAGYMKDVEENTGPSIWNKPKGEELVSQLCKLSKFKCLYSLKNNFI